MQHAAEAGRLKCKHKSEREYRLEVCQRRNCSDDGKGNGAWDEGRGTGTGDRQRKMIKGTADPFPTLYRVEPLAQSAWGLLGGTRPSRGVQ